MDVWKSMIDDAALRSSSSIHACASARLCSVMKRLFCVYCCQKYIVACLLFVIAEQTDSHSSLLTSYDLSICLSV